MPQFSDAYNDWIGLQDFHAYLGLRSTQCALQSVKLEASACIISKSISYMFCSVQSQENDNYNFELLLGSRELLRISHDDYYFPASYLLEYQ